jgi:hypothetical protein
MVLALYWMVLTSRQALSAAVVHVSVGGRVGQAVVVFLESRMSACIGEGVATTTLLRAASCWVRAVCLLYATNLWEETC